MNSAFDADGLDALLPVALCPRVCAPLQTDGNRRRCDPLPLHSRIHRDDEDEHGIACAVLSIIALGSFLELSWNCRQRQPRTPGTPFRQRSRLRVPRRTPQHTDKSPPPPPLPGHLVRNVKKPELINSCVRIAAVSVRSRLWTEKHTPVRQLRRTPSRAFFFSLSVSLSLPVLSPRCV